MDEICALAQISDVQEPLGTLNGWSCLGRFLANFFIVMNPTCPKIFANILRTTRLLHCTEEPLGLRLPNATPELVLYSGEHSCERMRISWPCGECVTCHGLVGNSTRNNTKCKRLGYFKLFERYLLFPLMFNLKY